MWLGLAGILVVLALAAWPMTLIVLRRRRRTRRRNAADPRDQLAGCWLELLDRVRDLGIDLPETMSRAQVAERIVAAEPVAVDVRWLAREIDGALFGCDGSSPAVTDELVAAAWAGGRRIVRQLASATPWRRRLLMATSPGSLRTRRLQSRQVAAREASEAAIAQWSSWGPPEQAAAMGFLPTAQPDGPVEAQGGETSGMLTIRVRHTLPSRHRARIGDNG